jgi:hypothetical protein
MLRAIMAVKHDLTTEEPGVSNRHRMHADKHQADY